MADTADIARVLAAHGVELHRRGKKHVATCPMHGPKERHTLTVDVTNNTWTCPSCSPEPSSPVEFVMRIEGVSRRHAHELLRAGSFHADNIKRGPRGRQKTIVPTHATTRALTAPFGIEDDDKSILTKLVGYYHGRLTQNPEALDYLHARGLRHSRLVEHFKLGLADRTLALRLPMANRKTGAELRGRLQRLGVLRSSGHEHLNGCLVVPLLGPEGHVVNIYGRKIGDRLRAGTELHVWLRPEKNGVFNLSGLTGATTVIVTTSIIDAMTLWSFGIEHVTAIHGLDGPVDDLLTALGTVNPKKVIFVLRRTKDAGAAVEKLAPMVIGFGAEVFRAVLPMEMDVNDIARTENAAEKIARVIRSAEWVAGTTPQPSPKPKAQPKAPTSTPKTHEMLFTFDERKWRVRGLNDNRAIGVLRVNIFVARDDVGFHADTFDVYSSRHRTAFVREAGQELCLDEQVLKKDLGKILLALEEAQDDLLREVTEARPLAVNVSPEDREEALALLTDPQLLERVLSDFKRIGVVGEKTNLVLGYLVAMSRKLPKPLALVIQSSAAAGKSRLMEAILSFVPEEDRVELSALTSQSIFYMRSSSLAHKVLSIAEEVGAERASYSLKLLQSDGFLSIATTGKDTTGRLVAHHYRVEGPVALMMTTTRLDLDEELLSRCIVVSVDESPEQTRMIHEAQRRARTLDGLTLGDEHAVLRLHRNIQRLIERKKVVNPHAMTMGYADLRVRARRDHAKLLTLIDVGTLVHQHQRPVRQVERDGAMVEFVEATADDVAFGVSLFGKIVHDDLPPATKKILDMLVTVVTEGKLAMRFTRRQARDALGVGDSQLRVHLHRLVDAEFVRRHYDDDGVVRYSLAVSNAGGLPGLCRGVAGGLPASPDAPQTMGTTGEHEHHAPPKPEEHDGARGDDVVVDESERRR